MVGSVQTKKGRLYLVTYVMDASGKKKQKWLSLGLPDTASDFEIGRAYNAKMAEVENMPTSIDANILLCDYVKYLLKRITDKNELKPTTLTSYMVASNKHIIPYFKSLNIAMRDVKPRMIENYYDAKMGKDGLSSGTIRLHHSILHSVFKLAFRDELIQNNPMLGVELPKHEFVNESHALNAEQVNHLLELLKQEKPMLYNMVYLTVVYGLRRGELLGLKWDCIDIEKMTIEIKNIVTVAGNKIYLQECTKTKSSNRIYPINKTALEILKRLKSEQDNYKIVMGNNYCDDNYVFAHINGTFYSPEWVYKSFSRFLEKHSLPHIRFHDLRHSCASIMLEKDIPLFDVSKWLGHSNISTTSNIYGHMFDAKKKQISNILSEVF